MNSRRANETKILVSGRIMTNLRTESDSKGWECGLLDGRKSWRFRTRRGEEKSDVEDVVQSPEKSSAPVVMPGPGRALLNA
jgi:hypothetical protein